MTIKCQGCKVFFMRHQTIGTDKTGCRVTPMISKAHLMQVIKVYI